MKRKNTKKSIFKKHLPVEISLLAAIAVAGLSLYMMKQSADIVPSTPVIASVPASLILTAPSGGTADVGELQHVAWVSENYAAPTVSVNVIRKVSDNPATYEVVRTVAVAKSNNGSAVWVPAKSDVGNETLIQVGCVSSTQACTAGISPSSLAVIDDGRYENVAGTYQALEALYNR